MTTDQSLPQIYLVTPPDFELAVFPDRLAACLDAVEIACIRLALAGRDEDRIGRAADALREVAHARDVALVVEDHVVIAERHGLDGVHLMDSFRSVQAMRKRLGPDAVVGAWCGTSRHAGMTAGELGADYVSFGPAGATALGTGARAELELYQWWSEMIEVPVVAEGSLDEGTLRGLAPYADFVALGDEIWREDDAATALARYAAILHEAPPASGAA